MANKYMERHSVSLNIRETQTKPTVRYSLTPVRMDVINKTKQKDNKCRRGCGDTGALVYCWWECTMVQAPWKTVWRFLKKTKNRTTICPRKSTSGCIFERIEISILRRYLYFHVHCSLIKLAKIRNNPSAHQ